MKIKPCIYSLIIFLLLFFQAKESFVLAKAVKKNNTSFAVLGHLYPIIDDSIRLEKLINKINKQALDYVFILGDSGLYRKEIVDNFREKFKAPVYFVAGNHDLRKERRAQYLQAVGYMSKVIEGPNANFVLFYSGDELENIQAFLKEKLETVDKDKPTILMTHHRIWDDDLLSPRAWMHDKSYLFKELTTVFDNRVDYIFAGNSNRQYLGHSDINTELAFLTENINGMECISAGMGNAKPKSSYVIAELKGSKIKLKSHFLTMSETGIPCPKDLPFDAQKYLSGFFIFLALIALILTLRD